MGGQKNIPRQVATSGSLKATGNLRAPSVATKYLNVKGKEPEIGSSQLVEHVTYSTSVDYLSLKLFTCEEND